MAIDLTPASAAKVEAEAPTIELGGAAPERRYNSAFPVVTLLLHESLSDAEVRCNGFASPTSIAKCDWRVREVDASHARSDTNKERPPVPPWAATG
ncbi:MAG: hypothetical protein ACR2GZ_02040 [Solirubrobacteraceae bacterium]